MKDIAKIDMIHALHEMAECMRQEADILKSKAHALEDAAELVNKGHKLDNIGSFIYASDLQKQHTTAKLKQAELMIKLTRLSQDMD